MKHNLDIKKYNFFLILGKTIFLLKGDRNIRILQMNL